MILEYMLIKKNNGLTVPEWVEEPGYFFDSNDNTYIGWSPDLENRQYYIPDSVVVLDEAALAERIYRLYKIDNPDLTMEEATKIANNWFNARRSNFSES